MEKRVKIIHWLTAVALVTLVATQGYWLFNRYVYSLQQYEEELYQKTTDAGREDKLVRKELQDKNLYTFTNTGIRVRQNNDVISDSEMEWIFNAHIIDKNQILSMGYDSLSLEQMDSLYNLGKGVKKYRFEIKGSDRGEHDVYDALERFYINELCPFTTERFDSLLQKHGIKPLSVTIETVDSIIWNPSKTGYTSIWNPIVEVTYPFDILQKKQVQVTYELGISPILGRMLESLIASIILSLLLIFCLIYQTKTIFKQHRIDELRKDFIKTMVHELKRPVATLKMCISFMKNDKMMQDKAMKEDIIRSSQNELDNLSSYFSKLRDLTYGDVEEIPLNLSTFNVKNLLEECITKQHLPSDRKINIQANFDSDDTEITADRMHVANIICNLLENAVKYSEGKTLIRVNCHSAGDKYILEVSDNGIGIPAAECDYVFDKYFRSASIVDKNIPGIGLGLCYVKLLVDAHKGKISLESELGKGSKFTVEIPKRQ